MSFLNSYKNVKISRYKTPSARKRLYVINPKNADPKNAEISFPPPPAGTSSHRERPPLRSSRLDGRKTVVLLTPNAQQEIVLKNHSKMLHCF